jgi:hypothetical protein
MLASLRCRAQNINLLLFWTWGSKEVSSLTYVKSGYKGRWCLERIKIIWASLHLSWYTYFHSLLVYLSCLSLQIWGLFNYIVIPCVSLMLLLPQANGWTCVDFGCTHPIDGLFWRLPIYLLGFFSKYECWVIDLIMLLLSFILLVCITRFHINMKC